MKRSPLIIFSFYIQNNCKHEKKIRRLRLTLSPLNSICFSCGPPRFLDFPPSLQPTFFSRINTWGREGLVPPSFTRYRTKKKNDMLCFFLLSFQTVHQFELKKQRLKRLLALLLVLSYKKDDPGCFW